MSAQNLNLFSACFDMVLSAQLASLQTIKVSVQVSLKVFFLITTVDFKKKMPKTLYSHSHL